MKLLRAPQAGNDQVIHFAVRLTDIGNVEAGRRNGQGLLKFALLTDDSQSAKSVRSVFKDWSACKLLSVVESVRRDRSCLLLLFSDFLSALSPHHLVSSPLHSFFFLHDASPTVSLQSLFLGFLERDSYLGLHE